MLIHVIPCWFMWFHVDSNVECDKSIANSIVSWIDNSIANSKSPPPILLISLQAVLIGIHICLLLKIGLFRSIHIYVCSYVHPICIHIYYLFVDSVHCFSNTQEYVLRLCWNSLEASFVFVVGYFCYYYSQGISLS